MIRIIAAKQIPLGITLFAVATSILAARHFLRCTTLGSTASIGPVLPLALLRVTTCTLFLPQLIRPIATGVTTATQFGALPCSAPSSGFFLQLSEDLYQNIKY